MKPIQLIVVGIRSVYLYDTPYIYDINVYIWYGFDVYLMWDEVASSSPDTMSSPIKM